MSMPDDYLDYPKRGYGQDHDFYDWRMAKDRPKITWDGGAKVAVCFIVPLEFFPLNPSGVPFKHSGAMVTPYPDLRHFTVRDYGNRVGVYRILDALNQAGVNATFAVNGQIATRYPPLLQSIRNASHEVAAHGLSTDHIHHEGLSRDEETTLVNETLKCFDDLTTGSTGTDADHERKPLSGWLSPARNQSRNTLGIIRNEDFGYCLDWEMDQVPVQANTPQGPITLIPNNYELSDFNLLHMRKQTEQSWLSQMKDSIDLLLEEHARFGGQMLGLTLTPYVIGQPFRIWALRELLAHINDTDGVEVFTAGDIHKQFIEQL